MKNPFIVICAVFVFAASSVSATAEERANCNPLDGIHSLFSKLFRPLSCLRATRTRSIENPDSIPKPPAETITLFDGKTLKGWKKVDFGGEGEVHVKDGNLILEMGASMTGVNYVDHKSLPRSNYEVTLEAMRVDGTDFFCGLTFPVKKDPCSLIIGGWGGGLCGLSSIDGMDASENDTTTFQKIKNKQWYRIRLRVTDDRIDAWLDDKLIVEQELKDHEISIRIEVTPNVPFGISTWVTTAALRNLKVRRLPKPVPKTGAKTESE